VSFVALAARASVLKETKDTDASRKTVFFVALSKGVNIDEVKEPHRKAGTAK
jgi:hypothetical protein